MAKFNAHTILDLISNLISNLITPNAGAAGTHPIDPALRGPPLEYQKSSKLVQLPEDILLTIAHRLTLADRACLLRTCRYFRELLEAVQYRHLDLSNPPLYYRTDRLHRTLSERPDLIPYIITYRGPITAGTLLEPIKQKPQRIRSLLGRRTAPQPQLYTVAVSGAESFQRAISIFPNAVNIRELGFVDGTDWASNPNWEPITSAIPNLSLTHFSLLIASESAEVVPQLQAQPELEHLELSWVPARLGDLKETDIPKLRFLRATLQDAATIVPGRPVEEFHHVLRPEELGLDEHLVQKLSLSRGPITTLVTRLHHPSDRDSVRNVLQVFACHLPELQNLTLIVMGEVSGQIMRFRHFGLSAP
ncbi:hypothetical protein FRC01_008586 [Tulasnella sp. 417]|nr:hypothetical protein FRC01_008586 [Tulasnella sp. 417]